MSIKPEDENRDFLYKYRPLIGEDESHINEHTLKILEKGELFFSKPSQFNDPFDTKINLDINVTEPELRAYYSRLLTQQGEPLNRLDAIIDKVNSGEINLEEIALKNTQPDYFNIFCLSKDEKNILMWSHYAKDHTGICIGFKIHKKFNSMNIKISSSYTPPPSVADLVSDLVPAIYINYCTNRPKPYNHFKDNLKELELHFMTKSKLWEYEQEVRIMLTNKMIHKNPICLETKEIGEIIFGLRTPLGLIDKVKQIVNNYPDNGFHVKLYKCVEIKGKYAIDKEQI